VFPAVGRKRDYLEYAARLKSMSERREQAPADSRAIYDVPV
jgi:hypothetical protein